MEFSRLGKYEIVAKIGQGGMGEVYRAHDPVLGRDVAIKIMSAGADSDQELRKRFQREAQSAARLNHPNIVTVHDFGEDQGKLFIAMELLEGTDLKEIIASRTRLGLPAKLSLISQVSEGLAFAHERDLVHRDIKPGNIHVQRGGHVKVMDFGLARGSTSEMTMAGAILGTPNYMAPEQVRGETATRQSDVFALGGVFYELLTGRKAFDAPSLAGVVYRVMSVEPEPIDVHDRSLPPALSALITKAMAKDPADRYADAGDLLASLREVEALVRSSNSQTNSAEPSGRGGPSTPWPAPPLHMKAPTAPPPSGVITARPLAGPSEEFDHTLPADRFAADGEPLGSQSAIETLVRSSEATTSKPPPGRDSLPAPWPAPPRQARTPTGSPRTAALPATPSPAPEASPTTIPRTMIAERPEVTELAPPRRWSAPAPVQPRARTVWIAAGGVAAFVTVIAGPFVWRTLRPDDQLTMTETLSRVSPTPAPPTAAPASTPTLLPLAAAPVEPAAVTGAVREVNAALTARDEARAARALRNLAALAPGHPDLTELSTRAIDLQKRRADDARRATERAELQRSTTPLPAIVPRASPTPMVTAANVGPIATPSLAPPAQAIPTAAPAVSPTPPPMASAAPSHAPPPQPTQGEAAARQAIRGVLDEFRAAFERRDVEALRAVQPGVDYERMKSIFASVSSYLVRIDVKEVSVQGDVARATCLVTYNPVPKPAGRQKPVPTLFHLRRKGDLWIIDRVQAE